MSARALWAALLALLTVLWAPAALAHKPSDSYLSLNVAPKQVRGQWDIALRDLDYAIGLDADGNGEITWGEVRARRAEIAAYALARLALEADGVPCPLRPGTLQIDDHTDGAYAVLHVSAECAPAPTALRVSYRLFSDLDPQHRGLLRLEAAGQARTAIFSPQQPSQVFALAEISRWRQFADYAVEGVWHIWKGYDHILFLLSLLLPAVLAWRAGRWQPVDRFHDAFVDVVKIVTSFTVAHSITLSLATLGVIALPSRVVESAIAASVVLAALNNVLPVFHGRRWMVAFLFGLIHGFGFASVLADLGLPQGTLVLALVGFNLGVEAGQLAIVALFLPLAFAIRRTVFYRRVMMMGGSALVTLLATVWLCERAFNFKVMPF